VDAPGSGGVDPPQAPSTGRGRIPQHLLARGAFLALTAVSLYLLWPALLQVFSAWPRLLDLSPIWFVVMLLFEAGSFVCSWALIRLALRTKGWFVVATSQLSGNAFSRVVPGGAAAGGALQYTLLVQAGIQPTRVASGLTASSLLSTATVFALPVLSLPAVLSGVPVERGLKQAAVIGAGAFLILLLADTALLTTERPLRLAGAAIERLRNQVRRERPPTFGLPDRLVRERNLIRQVLGHRWWLALLTAVGNWALDYLALLAALTAVGTRPRPSLVLLAYVAAIVLGMIPLTPGGLGFVEAGLAAMLSLAGVRAADAVLSTLAYRLVSYWLPIPTGFVAYTLFRRRRERAGTVPGP